MKCTYLEFLEIILAHGFVEIRHDATSHRRYRGIVDGEVRFVNWSPHNPNSEIPIGTLQSMIRQSGLPKKRFRK
ncbi:MAG: type II toxin-antitoxin system HicA family toxin [Rhizobiales bacterium]|nr:type II toxin-antitoxin system HicA family toxin [Hyphomicrobiales bacterium]